MHRVTTSFKLIILLYKGSCRRSSFFFCHEIQTLKLTVPFGRNLQNHLHLRSYIPALSKIGILDDNKGSKPKQFIIQAKHLTVQSNKSSSLYNIIVWVAGLLSNNLHECSSQHPRLLTCHPRLCSSKMKNKVVYGFCTDHRPKPGSQYVSFIIVFIKIILPSCVKGSYNWKSR